LGLARRAGVIPESGSGAAAEACGPELKGDALRAAYQDIDAHLTAELCKLSLHLHNFVERRLVAEAVDGIPPGPEEGFRLGEHMVHVGSALVVDSRKRPRSG
jgi:hypothetical protein